MKKYFTADRETGTFIDEFKTYADALQAIRDYEKTDMENGIYEKDFYEVVDVNHCRI